MKIGGKEEPWFTGPWRHREDGTVFSVPDRRDVFKLIDGPKVIDSAFVVFARTAVPELVAEVERLQQLVEMVEWSAGPSFEECPWCGVNGMQELHAIDCPAFPQDGEVE